MPVRFIISSLSTVFLILLVSGCSPKLAQKYGDYRIDAPVEDVDVVDVESDSALSREDKTSPVLDFEATRHSEEIEPGVTPETDADVLIRVAAALEASGWTLVEADVEYALATDKRQFASWLFYTVEAELEVIIIGRKYIRVMIHPWRHYFWGARGRIPYLKSGMARGVFESLEEKFTEQGFTFIGNAGMRDAANQKG